MMSRYAYFYFLKDEPERVRTVAPSHAAHWRELHLNEYLGGPFYDRGGGLITFEADDSAEASHAVDADPFITEKLVEEHWLKEWIAD